MQSEQDNQLKPFDNGTHKAKIITTVAILLVAVLLVVGIRAFSGKDSDDTSSNSVSSAGTPQMSQQTTNQSQPADQNATYKDGTYEATGTYTTPESTEDIEVTVTIKNGVVESADVATDANASESRQWQQRFKSGYKEEVIGKPLSSLSLNRVSGSSLTPNGFNDAIDAIRQQAQS